MDNKPYTYITDLYNHLMKEIDYEGWADYIFDIFKNLEIDPKYSLEIASGNCKLATHLKKRIGKIILTDISFTMMQKFAKNFNSICCDMKSLPFKNQFDFIFSSFDSVNYLLSKKDLLRFFQEINCLLTREGFFTFDVSLEQNSLRYERSLNRKGKFNSIKFIQKSKYEKKTKIHYNKFNVEFPDGTKVEEIHKQKIFEFNTYFRIAEKAGLTVKHCYNAFSFEDANLNDERIQFIIKKR